MKKLFPEFLDAGSKDFRAVIVLQALLRALRYNDGIVVDGEYGRETINAVYSFQAQNGLEQDGNFGPQTRLAFLKKTGIDVNSFPAL